MIVSKLSSFDGVSINSGIHERVIKILASPQSEIVRRNFTVGVSIVPPQNVHEEHQHDANQELIVVIGGKGTAKIAGVVFDVGVGSVISIDQGERHTFTNTGSEDLVLLWIYDPPGAEKKFIDLLKK